MADGPTPETRYARSGDVHIAYQVFGEGDVDVVLVSGFTSHVELLWEFEQPRAVLEAFGSFARMLNFDRRGTGLSDPVAQAPTLEERMDDLRAVMDDAGFERAHLIGYSEGAPAAMLFAATHPERVSSLVLYGGLARSTWAEDYPIGVPADDFVASGLELIAPHWGTGALIEVASPSIADNPQARAAFAKMERSTGSPGMLASMFQAFIEVDVRHIVDDIHVPTLVLHRTHDRLVNVRHGRWLSEHIPGARYVELPGDDHSIWGGDSSAIVGEMQEFMTGSRAVAEPDRVLATVLFTDIVDSTSTASDLGDHRWREILEGHDRLVRRELERFGGREIKTTGDGFLATFDGPARGVRCARAIAAAAPALGIHVRAGLHTGECEIRGDDIAGMAVHIAARVSSLAASDEILVSQTVRDLVAGSGLQFADRGAHTLKGVPGEWTILQVTG